MQKKKKQHSNPTTLSQISGTGKYIIPQGEALVPLTDPEFEATNGMHIDLPQSTLKDFLKN